MVQMATSKSASNSLYYGWRLGILVMLLIATSFVMPKNKKDDLTKEDQIVISTLINLSERIEKKYTLTRGNAGITWPGGPIQALALCFDTKCPYTKEQLRDLVIGSAQEFLEQINKNEEIQEFLKERPFTIKNIQIVIYNQGGDCGKLLDPEIATVQIMEGILSYRTIDPNNIF